MAALQQRTGGAAIVAALLASLTAAPGAGAGTPAAAMPSAAATAPTARPRPPQRSAQNQAPSAGHQSLRRLARQVAAPAARLNAEQRAIIGKINAYLSSVQQLNGKFVQVGPDGSRSQGDFYISKPGRVRFEYDDPSPIELIADGQSVVVRDRKLATQDVYPLSQTPLRFLLSDHVDLMKDSSLVAVYADDVFVTVVLEEKNGIVGTSRLMIMFNAKDMQLKQWTVTDPQGYDTTVAVYNLDTSKTPDPAMFRIDYTRYR